jgi:hydrogenase expression/formation protein HypE
VKEKCMNDEIITLDYGSGGKKTSKLIETMVLPAMDNPYLSELGDGAVLPGAEQIVFSTDSFVVSPLFFPGADIGKLAVCGTVNDIAMCGGEAEFLSCSLIIEEGLERAVLEKVLASMSTAAAKAGVKIVTGDTKVVEKGRGDGLYINTAGIGILRHPGLSRNAMRSGDAVILSGTAGDHGIAVMLARNGITEEGPKSDCAALGELCKTIWETGADIRVLRDPTRGGVATTLNEFVEGTALGIELEENAIPVRPEVQAACGLLGLDALYCANEGKLLCVTAPEDAERVLEAMHGTEEGKNAAVIGKVTEAFPGRVILKTAFGGSRILQKLSGAQLPRIC